MGSIVRVGVCLDIVFGKLLVLLTVWLLQFVDGISSFFRLLGIVSVIECSERFLKNSHFLGHSVEFLLCFSTFDDNRFFVVGITRYCDGHRFDGNAPRLYVSVVIEVAHKQRATFKRPLHLTLKGELTIGNNSAVDFCVAKISNREVYLLPLCVLQIAIDGIFALCCDLQS